MAVANLIIAGVNKAGTTSLHNYLSAHPDVCGADVKETFFWNRIADWDNVNLTAYEKHFGHFKDEKIVLDSTPRYFHDIAGNLSSLDKHLGSDLKIIIMLREPVKRLFSFYKYKKRGLDIDQDESFDTYVRKCFNQLGSNEKSVYNGLKDGLYAQDLKTWTDHFGDRIKVVFSDDLKTSRALMRDLSGWLEIDGQFYDSFEFTRDNESVDFKNEKLQAAGIKVFRRFQAFWNSMPWLKRLLTKLYLAINGKPFEDEISEEAVNRLRDFYAEDIKATSRILASRVGELPAWLNQ